MKYLPLLFLFLLIATKKAKSQKICFEIDKYQNFKYSNKYSSINDAVNDDSLIYFSGGQTFFQYRINVNDSTLVYTTKNKKDTLHITFFENSKTNNFEICATKKNSKDFPNFFHYLITEDLDKNLVLVTRWMDDTHVHGWFSPSINYFTYTAK